jgi:protein YibB
MSEPITIVTAFFDLDRGNWEGEKHGHVIPPYIKRSTGQYFNNFARLAKADNPMVIYTTSEYSDRIAEIRDELGYKDKTTVIVYDSIWDDFTQVLDKISSIQNNEAFIKGIVNPSVPEYWNAKYVLVNFMKGFFVAKANEVKAINTKQAAWIDFGYCREDDTLPGGLSWSYDFGDKINLFYIKEIEPGRMIPDIVSTGDVYLQGCHIVGPTDKWETFWNRMCESINALMTKGMIDDDQTLLLISALAYPDEFKLNKVEGADWFIIFKDYQ